MNEQNAVLSVIVPVYNVEIYLNQCIDSLINQTFKNFEIILVDDGSTDNSGSICDEFAEKYDNVFAFHKQNGGLSSARNYGIEKARGEYLAFIDSDDFVESNMFEHLVGNALKYNADISMCNFFAFFNDSKRIRREIPEKETTVYRGNDVLLRLYHEFSACNKIYKRNLFDDIKYPEGKLYEDARTTYRLAAKCDCAVLSPLCLYNYRQRSSSIMGTFSTINFLDRIKVWDEIFEFIEPCFPNEELKKIKIRKNKLIIELLMSILSKKQLKSNRQVISGMLCNLEKPLFSNPAYNLKEKLSTLFFVLYNALFIHKKEN